MPNLEAALVVYGAIDEIARTSTDPAILKLIEKRSPGSTRIAQRGWYTEYRKLSGGKLPAITVEGVNAALAMLTNVDVATSATPDGTRLTTYDIARLAKAVDLLAEIRKTADAAEAKNGAGYPRIALLDFDDAALGAVQRRIGALNAADSFSKCTSYVREVNGEYCTVLLTESTAEDIGVDALKPVLNPENWPMCSSFFTAMTPQPGTEQTEGWLPIEEVIGTGTGGGLTLRTPLRFWMGELPDGQGIFVNYDLDYERFDSADNSRLVVVDNGYVVATPLDREKPKQGVRLHTSKELAIRGVSPTATANLACRLGWGDAGEKMFFDVARNTSYVASGGFKPWAPTADGANTPPLPKRPAVLSSTWRLPPGNRAEIMQTVTDEAKVLLNGLTTAVGKTTDRWRDGLTPEDVTAIGTELGRDVSSSVQKLFAVAVDSVRPNREDQDS
ncbi:MAG TPA: hypothetical protein VFW21_14705 [Mycobacterium sp.]|nr:hypothetical protein [Mycobacterium sp.]